MSMDSPGKHENRAHNLLDHAEHTMGLETPAGQALIQMAQVRATLAVAAAIERLADAISESNSP